MKDTYKKIISILSDINDAKDQIQSAESDLEDLQEEVVYYETLLSIARKISALKDSPWDPDAFILLCKDLDEAIDDIESV